MYCRNCGKELSEKAVACPSCGFDPRTENNFCPECGVETNEKQVICINCGIDLKKPLSQSLNLTTNEASPKKINYFAVTFAVLSIISVLLPWINAQSHASYGGSSFQASSGGLIGLLTWGGFLGLIGSAVGLYMIIKQKKLAFLPGVFNLVTVIAYVALISGIGGSASAGGVSASARVEPQIGLFTFAIFSFLYTLFCFIRFGSKKKNIDFNSTTFKFGLPIFLAIISIVWFNYNGRFSAKFPYIELILMAYPLFFLKKEKYNSLFKSGLVLPFFFIVKYFLLLYLTKDNFGSNSNSYSNHIEFLSSFHAIFLFYGLMIIALILCEKFKDSENKFFRFARKINFDQNAYLWIIAGISIILALSITKLPLVSSLLLIFPVFLAFKETNRNIFMMALLLPIAYFLKFIIDQIDWYTIFEQSSFVSECYADSIYYAKPVYIILFLASIIYYSYHEIQESNMPVFINKMKMFIKLDWLIVLLTFIVLFSIMLSNGVIQSGEPKSESAKIDTLKVNTSSSNLEQTAEEDQPIVKEKSSVSARQIIDRYYEDLKSEDFEASRYFTTKVERFISMKNTTADEINKYVLTSYYKNYINNDYTIEEGSYNERNLENGDTEASFIEVGNCYKVKQQKNLYTRIKMEVLLNSDGLIYKWTQPAVLERR